LTPTTLFNLSLLKSKSQQDIFLGGFLVKRKAVAEKAEKR
jgi:hypothetical protein